MKASIRACDVQGRRRTRHGCSGSCSRAWCRKTAVCSCHERARRNGNFREPSTSTRMATMSNWVEVGRSWTFLTTIKPATLQPSPLWSKTRSPSATYPAHKERQIYIHSSNSTSKERKWDPINTTTMREIKRVTQNIARTNIYRSRKFKTCLNCERSTASIELGHNMLA